MTSTPRTSPAAAGTRRLLFGPYGLRAGWSLLCFLGMAAAIVFAAILAIKHSGVAQQQSPANAPVAALTFALFEGATFLTILFLSWLMARLERRRAAAFGLGGEHRVRRFLTGAFWGLATLSTLIGLLRLLHLLTFDQRLLHGFDILYWGSLQLIGFFLLACFEEYLYRGYLQFTLTRGLVGLGAKLSPTHARRTAFSCAAVVTLTLFVLEHTTSKGETWVGLLQVAVIGVVFLVALWRTGSLWWGIGFHMAWDWAQSFLYGVPDSGALFQGRLFATHASGNPLLSGGATGPEGSLLFLPITVILIPALFFTTRGPQPPLETQPAKAPSAQNNSTHIA